MITHEIKKILKNNWGEKAETMNCFAEVKLIDPLSSWRCYIFAMSEDETMICCLLYTKALGMEVYTIPFDEIKSMYNEEGESPEVDEEYRRTRVTELLKRYRNDSR